ncbi:MAG: hypothetical protein R3E89_14370 [Thiolinea sp.]
MRRSAASLQALLVLAQLGEDLNALFGGNDSVGSVMRSAWSR